MEDDFVNTGEQSVNKERPWLFKKGQSGNPSGRPKGSVSLKEYARRMLASMTDEERQEFMHGLPKEVIWKLAEGNPATNTDITTAGQALNIQISEVIAKKHDINSGSDSNS